MFAPLGFVPGLTPEQIEAVADPKRARQANLPTLRHAVKAGTWLIGPPELITEQLMEVQHKYPGLEVVNVGQPVGHAAGGDPRAARALLGAGHAGLQDQEVRLR